MRRLREARMGLLVALACTARAALTPSQELTKEMWTDVAVDLPPSHSMWEEVDRSMAFKMRLEAGDAAVDDFFDGWGVEGEWCAAGVGVGQLDQRTGRVC